MKVLFAVSNDSISNSIVLKYQQKYKEIITSKNVYYFNAIIKELQKDKTYDIVIIGEDLEPISNNNYDTIDKFIFEKLDNISDEASKPSGEDIPIILICSDRRTKSDSLLIKLFGIGIYNALLGNDRNIDMVCDLINKPRNKKEAKEYYRIESEDVNYKPEKDTEVSENEIQNILAHYKKIGNNEKKCIESFDSIASQYNDTQLRIIVKFLPKNVKQILEVGSKRYQALMSGGTVLSNGQYSKYEVQNHNIDVLTKDLEKPNLTKPVVIPQTMDIKPSNNETQVRVVPNVQKPVQNMQPLTQNGQMPVQNNTNLNEQRPVQNNMPMQNNNGIQNGQVPVQNNTNSNEQRPVQNNMPMQNNNGIQNGQVPVQNNTNLNEQRPVQNNMPMQNNNKVQNSQVPVQDDINSNEQKSVQNNMQTIQQNEEISNNENLTQLNNMAGQTLNNIQNVNQIQEETKPLEEVNNMSTNDNMNNNMTQPIEGQPKRRGRPRKIIDETNVDTTPKKGRGRPKKSAVVENVQRQGENLNLFGLANNGFEDVNLFAMSEEPINENRQPLNTPYMDTRSPYLNNANPYETFNNQSNANSYNPMRNDELIRTNNMNNNVVMDGFVAKNSKLVAFVGTSKNGTSFVVYNLAELLAQKGIKTAILDLTKNKNSYYMYTDNNQTLMQAATNSIKNLSRGIAKGVTVNNNLTVYTSLPGEDNDLENYGTILQTLDENYSAVLMDCDFEANVNYFAKSTEMYLVQSMDALTIQPLTLFLSELKLKGALNENKLRVIINKEIKSKILNPRMILGGMAKYNEPSMTLQRDLFNPNTVRHITIPFEEQTYAKYIEAIATCKISLNGYSEKFMASLNELANLVYPLIPGSMNNGYTPPNYSQPKKGLFSGRDKKQQEMGQFSSGTNGTLDKMRTNF